MQANVEPKEVMKKIEDLSKVIQLVYNMYNRDHVNLGLTLAGSCLKISEGLSDLNIVLNDELFDDLFPDASKEEIVLLAPSGEKSETGPFMRIIKSWLPKEISASPTFSKLGMFIAVLCGIDMVTGFMPLPKLFAHISAEDLVSTGTFLDVITKAVVAVVKGVKRAYTSGSAWDFFEMPKDVAFIYNSERLLYAPPENLTQPEIEADIAEIQSLIASRTYLDNDTRIQRTLEKLRAKTGQLMMFLNNASLRKQPFPIMMTGVPGTGKTQAVDFLIRRRMVLKKEKDFVGKVTKVNVYDKYPASSGINPLSDVIVMNDIPDNYVDFPKRDLIPLDVFLQMMLDSYPFYLRAAAVDQKGICLSKIDMVIMTANFWTYIFPGAAEKLVRRLEVGLSVDVYVVDDKGKRVPYEVFQNYGLAERNDRWRFQVLQVSADCNHLKFEKTQLVLNLQGFLKLFDEKIMAWDTKQDAQLRMFSTNICPCGLPSVVHSSVVKERDELLHHEVDYPVTFQQLSVDCCGLSDVGSLDTFSHFRPLVYSTQLAALSLRDHYQKALTFIQLVITFTLWALFGQWQMQINKTRDSFSDALVVLKNVAARKVATSRVLMDVSRRLLPTRLYYQLLSLSKYEESVRFYDQWSPLVLGAMFVVFMGAVARCFVGKKESELLAKPIFASQVSPSSMVTVVTNEQPTFPVDKRRSWAKKDATLHVGTIVSGVASDNLVGILNAARIEVTMTDGHSHRNVFVSYVTPTHFLMNKHYWNDFDGDVVDFVYKGLSHPIRRSECLPVPASEFLLVHGSFPVNLRGVLKFLPRNPLTMGVDITLDGQTWYPAYYEGAVTVDSGTYPAYCIPNVFLPPGACTQWVMGKFDTGSFIAGYVFARHKKGTLFTTVTQDMISEALVSEPFGVVEDLELLMGFPLEELSINSELRNVPSVFLTPLGTIPGPVSSFSTKLRKTRIYEDVVRSPLLTKSFSVPGRDRIITADNEYYSSFLHTYGKLDRSCDITRTEAFDAATSFAHDTVSRLKPGEYKLGSITLQEAIFGIPELGIDRINFKTSMGPSLKRECGIRDKYDTFEVLNEDSYEFKEVVKAKIDHLIDSIDTGVVIPMQVENVNKDEVRETAKVDIAKLRLFCVMDGHNNLLGRMLMMPYLALRLSQPFASECFGGMNAASTEWSDLAHWLRKMEEFLDLDYASYDLCQCIMTIYMYAVYVATVHKLLGATEEHIRRVYIYCYMLSWQVLVFKNCAALKRKGMPTGSWATLDINSVTNSCLVRIAFQRLNYAMMSFTLHVRVGVVGDDNVLGKSKKVPDFNLLTLQVLLAGMGFEITDAAKTGVLKPTIPFEKLVFVKRSFKPHAQLGYVAPLDTNSIIKSMLYESKESGVSSIQRLEDISAGAQREAWLHGRAFFSEFQAWLEPIYLKHKMRFVRLDHNLLWEEYTTKTFQTFAV